MNKKHGIPPPLQEAAFRYGLDLMLSVAKDSDLFRMHEVKLMDGDTVYIFTYNATGIKMLFERLGNEANKDRFKKMTLLELLRVYEEAVKKGILTGPALKRYSVR